MNNRLEETSLNIYFKDIGQSNPLSREKEAELASKIKEGDLEARDELVQANLPFVVNVAKSFQNRGLSLHELISAGNYGLLIAAERFDGTKGFKFISYAVWWLRQSILLALAEQTRTVHLPLNKQSLLKDIHRITKELAQGQKNKPDIEKIAERLDLPLDEVEEALLSDQAILSLDEPFNEQDENLLYLLADASQELPDNAAVRDSSYKQLQHVLSELNEREQLVIMV
jgi:RNA polymerase primary sigma factor